MDDCNRILSQSRRSTGSHMHTPPSTRPSSVHSENGSAELGAFSPVTPAGDVGRHSNTGRRGAARPAGTATPPIRASSCSWNAPPTESIGASELETRLHRAQSHHHLSDLVGHDAYLPLVSTFAESPRSEPSSEGAANSKPFSPSSTARSAATTSRRLLAVANALQSLSPLAPGSGSEREERSHKHGTSDERELALHFHRVSLSSAMLTVGHAQVAKDPPAGRRRLRVRLLLLALVLPVLPRPPNSARSRPSRLRPWHLARALWRQIRPCQRARCSSSASPFRLRPPNPQSARIPAVRLSMHLTRASSRHTLLG